MTSRFSVVTHGFCLVSLAALLGGCASRQSPPPPAAPPPAPVQVSPAAQRAIDFLRAQKAMSLSTLVVVRYLERQFGLEPFPAALAPGGEAQMRFFGRLIDPSLTLSAEDLAPLSELEGTNALAIHCDRVPLPADYLERLRKLASGGGRRLGQAFLPLIWAVDNGCIRFESARALAAENRAALAEEAERDFERLEGVLAIVFLQRFGFAEDVKPEWIARLLAGQNADGGWVKEEAKDCDFRRTAVALMVLLAHDNPGRAWLPWPAPRPA